MAKVDRALELAERGFFVFPLLPDSKKPVEGVSYLKQATRDPAAIIARWAENPDYNIAIFCGRFGNDGELLFIVDVDTKNDKRGAQSLVELEMDVELPTTAEQITQSGGRHLIYRLPASIGHGGTDTLGAGIDTRTGNNYIVAPGSTINGAEYRWSGEYRPPVRISESLLARAKKPILKAEPGKGVCSDSPTNVAAAMAVARMADPAVKGAGGNDAAFRAATAIRDTGVSEHTARIIMRAVYADRCDPPWHKPTLERIVRNAYRYAALPQGNASPEADFPPVTPGEIEWEPKRKRWRPKRIKLPAAHEIEPRQWLFGNRLMIGKVSVLIAPPGVGKSTYSSGATLAVVTGEQRILDELVHETGEVLIVANEEEQDEVNRRLAALTKYHELDPAIIEDRIHFATASDETAFELARSTKNGPICPIHRDDLLEYLNEHPAIKLVVIDPFVETHGCDENSNKEINDVARMYRAVAVQTGTAILIIHHTRKPPAGSSDAHIGNMDSGRGASSLTGVARVVGTLYSMTKKDAKSRKLEKEQAFRWVRLDDAKGNLHLISSEAKWYYKESVPLMNGPNGIDGDSVGILVPGTPPPPKEGEDGGDW